MWFCNWIGRSAKPQGNGETQMQIFKNYIESYRVELRHTQHIHRVLTSRDKLDSYFHGQEISNMYFWFLCGPIGNPLAIHLSWWAYWYKRDVAAVYFV